MNKNNIKVKIHGNILKELSEKLPNYSIALNELMKNSYDACATLVSISIDSTKNEIVIYDDGHGMNYEAIETLFHLSNSNKKYGQINVCGRPTQGSKGLGFLSVFKFGHYVKWQTVCENVKYVFEFDYDKAVKANSLSDFDINCGLITTEEKSFTKITIHSSKDIVSQLLAYFSDESVLYKTVYSFLDSSFVVEINIDGKISSSTNKIDLSKILPSRLLYKVNYSSVDNYVVFSNNLGTLFTLEFDKPYAGFQVILELHIFDLTGTTSKRIHKLFQSPIKNVITPLVYTNNNFFANFSLWNTDVMRPIQNSQVLSQMIGHVNIISSDDRMDFNAERTDFVQNELTKTIYSILNELNKFIQINGSDRKKYLLNNEFIDEEFIHSDSFDLNEENAYSAIKSDFFFKDEVKIEINGNSLVYKFHTYSKNYTVLKKKANFTEVQISHNIPKIIHLKKGQMNLRKYIYSATNSISENILDDLIIKIDGIENDILPSYDAPTVVKVDLCYIDSNTGNFSITQEVSVIKEDIPPLLPFKADDLIEFNTIKDYSITFSNTVNTLIQEVNTLFKSETRPLYVLATAIRAVFELSLVEIIKSGKLKSIIKTNNTDVNDLTENVKQIVKHGKQPQIISYFAASHGEPPKAIKAVLNASDYEQILNKCNLGAHTSMVHLTVDSLKSMGKMAAYFVVLTNEIIKNPTVK